MLRHLLAPQSVLIWALGLLDMANSVPGHGIRLVGFLAQGVFPKLAIAPRRSAVLISGKHRLPAIPLRQRVLSPERHAYFGCDPCFRLQNVILRVVSMSLGRVPGWFWGPNHAPASLVRSWTRGVVLGVVHQMVLGCVSGAWTAKCSCTVLGAWHQSLPHQPAFQRGAGSLASQHGSKKHRNVQHALGCWLIQPSTVR